MSHALDSLSRRLESILGRRTIDTEEHRYQLPIFSKLQEAATALEYRFEGGTPPQPPIEKRLKALTKFHESPDSLSSSEWKLVFYGLTDKLPFGHQVCVLDDEDLYSHVARRLRHQLIQESFSRRDWLALCSSYFGYSGAMPEANTSWCDLRRNLRQGYRQIISSQNKPKFWTTLVNRHIDVFSDDAGASLGRCLLMGDTQDLTDMENLTSITANSWLWKKIFGKLFDQLFEMDDEAFYSRIDTLIKLLQQHNAQADDILAATLTRYAQSKYIIESHLGLKAIALSQWGSPQIKLERSRWAQHVDDDVCKMVLRWFAKADLEHFFKLLQGERGVDQNRLNYWLRFVDQMQLTRIVMGKLAMYDRSPEFVNFRRENKGRFSQLTDAVNNNNAFLMQIGNYVFVEFSSTGNACYYYNIENLPFSFEEKLLSLQYKLKRGSLKFNHNVYWESKTDRLLSSLGILPGMGSPRPSSTLKRKWINRSVSNTEIENKFSTEIKISNHEVMDDKAAKAISQVYDFIDIERASILDNRDKGGAFWIKILDENYNIGYKLRKLGFSNNNDRSFWIK